MSSLFIWDGIVQLRDLGGTLEYLASLNVPVPNVAIWFSIALHLLGGLAILVGFKTRWAAAVLALFCLGTGFGVHLPIGDTENMVNFYKNLVMAGGFLYVVTYGAGIMSIDGADRI
jgi:putative oxidoreductase